MGASVIRSRAALRAVLSGLAVVYGGAAALGLAVAFVAPQVTVVWPPTGIALAAMLLLGYRTWPGIWIGAFVVNAVTDEPLATAAAIATGNTLEAVVATWLLHRAGFRRSFGRLRDVLAFGGLAVASSTMVSATIGTASLCLGGVQPCGAFGHLWVVWWIGDAMGALVVAPASSPGPGRACSRAGAREFRRRCSSSSASGR